MPSVPTSNDAYLAAADIDAEINDLVEKFPPTEKYNKPFWRIFLRVVKSSIIVLEDTL